MGEHALEVKSRWPTRGMVERISYIYSGRSLAFTHFQMFKIRANNYICLIPHSNHCCPSPTHAALALCAATAPRAPPHRAVRVHQRLPPPVAELERKFKGAGQIYGILNFDQKFSSETQLRP